MGKLLVGLGILLMLVGLLVMALERFRWFGRLPGDINIQRENWSFHFPVVTCVILSILLSIILSIFARR